MSRRFGWLVGAGAVVFLLATPLGASAQGAGTPIGGDIKYSSGQNVQPIFQGWSKNPDGSFNMHFGYLNRNHVEELHVPIGPDNNVEPGGPDRAQPTYFYRRFNRDVFTVRVPSDWGKSEVVWTVTVRGRTDRAVAWLQPEWEIATTPRGFDATVKNTPPTIAVDPGQSLITLPAPLTLTAAVGDDGLPPPGSARQAGNSENPPTFRPPRSATAPVNVPEIQLEARARGNRGLTVTWLVWRGPAGVAFDPKVGPVKDGKAVTTAIFTKPGAYVLRARANDTWATTIQDVTIAVKDPQ